MMKTKVIVITGASSGIGFTTGEYLAAKGYKVYGFSRRKRENSAINYIACDVTDKKQVKAAFEQINEDIYAVINNAGIGISGPVEYAAAEDIQKIIDVNIIGVINVCQIAIPYLRKSKGKIINIGSVAGDLIIPFQTFYSITKAAVHALTQGLNMELKPFGIKAITVLPGDTKTSFTANRYKNVVQDEIYKERVKKSVLKMEKDEQEGKDPVTVSKVIYRVLKKKNPPLKVTVGVEYKALVFLKRLLPLKFVNSVIYHIYGGE
ncbi:MAG: SDR family NAD(P)-dependent oxidoreductase [Bacilli bacterium]|nr:SDR family NAD(P)-dependent oxidoreductase [Bacilli bacterium]MDD4076686.1 SDR family NAD(P)-dependent oxidoreductase [Bacilli bacterium]MDD4388515.1 SDR family NAD(P)-dependent oxidoreductase [Bacilli bacterium]